MYFSKVGPLRPCAIPAVKSGPGTSKFLIRLLVPAWNGGLRLRSFLYTVIDVLHGTTCFYVHFASLCVHYYTAALGVGFSPQLIHTVQDTCPKLELEPEKLLQIYLLAPAMAPQTVPDPPACPKSSMSRMHTIWLRLNRELSTPFSASNLSPKSHSPTKDASVAEKVQKKHREKAKKFTKEGDGEGIELIEGEEEFLKNKCRCHHSAAADPSVYLNPSPKKNKRKSESSLTASPTKKVISLAFNPVCLRPLVLSSERLRLSRPRTSLLHLRANENRKKPASTDSTSDDDQAILTWNDLPKNCPATLCSDRLPSEPVPRILSLFSRLKTLTDAEGPSAKGSAFIQLEICQAITTEKRCRTILRLGKERRWPEAIVWDSIQYRMDVLKPDITRLFKDSSRLEDCPIWRSFLLDVNYELLEFCQSDAKQEFKAALLGKRCGYYGPQGEFLIYSCVLRLLSELDKDDDTLEVRLTSTIQAIVVEGVDRENFHYDDNDILTANYLCLDDFIRFILVPYVASALILEDQHWLQTLQDASFERTNSQEYGELVFPENIEGDGVDRIHQQNIVVTKARNEAKITRDAEQEKLGSAPPKHRKHTDDNSGPLKICLPLPRKIQEQEITLKDFPPPSSSRQKPKATPKKKQAQEQVKEVKTNSKGQKALKYTLSRRFGPHIATHRPLNTEIRDFHDIHQEGRDSKPSYACHPRRQEDPLRAWVYYERFLADDTSTISETGDLYICSVLFSGISRWAEDEGIRERATSPLISALLREVVGYRVDRRLARSVRRSLLPFCDTRRKILTRTPYSDAIHAVLRTAVWGQRVRRCAHFSSINLITLVPSPYRRPPDARAAQKTRSSSPTSNPSSRPFGKMHSPLRAHRPSAARHPFVHTALGFDGPKLHGALRISVSNSHSRRFPFPKLWDGVPGQSFEPKLSMSVFPSQVLAEWYSSTLVFFRFWSALTWLSQCRIGLILALPSQDDVIVATWCIFASKANETGDGRWEAEAMTWQWDFGIHAVAAVSVGRACVCLGCTLISGTIEIERVALLVTFDGLAINRSFSAWHCRLTGFWVIMALEKLLKIFEHVTGAGPDGWGFHPRPRPLARGLTLAARPTAWC
ncbi:hypothetical protein DFH06DRAFT_1122292 [Mycena polygramma]|nr:hypothetical protein DFH06DRAFT_1122292 [Mycena polygramma]